MDDDASSPERNEDDKFGGLEYLHNIVAATVNRMKICTRAQHQMIRFRSIPIFIDVRNHMTPLRLPAMSTIKAVALEVVSPTTQVLWSKCLSMRTMKRRNEPKWCH